MRITKFSGAIIVALLFFLMGCNPNIETQNTHQNPIVSCAQLFDLDADSEDVILLNGKNTDTITFIDNTGDKLLIDRNQPRYVCLSSTHIAFLMALGEGDHIVGVSDSSYIFNKEIKKMITAGKVQVISNGAGMNNELIIDLQPTVIFCDRMQANAMAVFEQHGIPVVYIEEYREVTPLARAEWIRVFGRIIGKSAVADSLFFTIQNKYESLVEKVVNNVTVKPKIFGGMEYQGVWYVSGGKSYISAFYKDAGAEYLFDDNDKSASIPLDFEVVYNQGADADYWRIIQSSNSSITYEDLSDINQHYSDFPAFKQKKIIFCNPLRAPYFEDGVLEPEVILSDFVYAMHPQLLEDYHPKYYYLLP